MKELNDFRNFLNEDLDEGVIDKLKKFGKKVKDVADKMDGGDDHGGIFHNVPGGKPTPRNRQEEVEKTQEGEIHEGTWALGSVSEMLKALALLEKLRKMGGVKGSLELDKLDTMLYYVFGDDEFQDAIDRAKDNATDDDRFANAISDAQARGLELYKDEFRDAKSRGETGFEFKPRFGLEENDSVLDEVIEEGNIFDEIDEMTKTLAVHMSTEDVLEELMSELQIIQGGTKVLHRALKNIMIDADLMEGKEEE